MERHEEEVGEFKPGRSSKPINLATKVGVFAPGEDKSFKFPAFATVLPLVLICIFFWIFKIFKWSENRIIISIVHYYHYSLYSINKPNQKWVKLIKTFGKCGRLVLTGILKFSSFEGEETVPSTDSKLFLGASAPELHKTMNKAVRKRKRETEGRLIERKKKHTFGDSYTVLWDARG